MVELWAPPEVIHIPCQTSLVREEFAPRLSFLRMSLPALHVGPLEVILSPYRCWDGVNLDMSDHKVSLTSLRNMPLIYLTDSFRVTLAIPSMVHARPLTLLSFPSSSSRPYGTPPRSIACGHPTESNRLCSLWVIREYRSHRTTLN